jgi:hypothetical protein
MTRRVAGSMLAATLSASLLVGCGGSAALSVAPSISATVTPSVAPLATASPAPSATPSPSPTPLPPRSSIVNAPHPTVSSKSAYAALDASDLALIQATNKASYDQCRELVTTYPHEYDLLLSCTGVIYPLYREYIRTGDEKYYAAALTFFNYVWNWNNASMPGVANGFDQTYWRNAVVEQLTRGSRADFPEYGNTIP